MGGACLPGTPGVLALIAAIAGILGLATLPATARNWPDEVPNFSLLDMRGQYYEFHRTSSRALVLFFTENGCPIARQYLHQLQVIRDEFPESDVAIWAVDSNPADDRASLLQEAQELGLAHTFPFLRDDSQGLAQLLGVTRSATVVAISARDGHVFYHGALDDQLSEGTARPAATKKYLAVALHAFLKGQRIKQPVTEAHGCLLDFAPQYTSAGLSYARDVAPILEHHCLPCHSPGNIGPFALPDFTRVKARSAMIQEVVLSHRMPPWSADPEIGHYQHERALTLAETRTLLGWIAQGSPRGEGADPLPTFPVPPAPAWPLGPPDGIVKMSAPESVPATGVLEYRHVKIPTPFAADTWLAAVAIKPGNRKVIHHCIVRVQSAKGEDDGTGLGTWLQGWAPGIESQAFPAGTGRLLPKGSVLDLELHYTTMGRAQTDDTQIGLYKLAAPPKSVLRNQGAYNLDFSLAPGAAEANVAATIGFRRDTLLYAMSPHMHLRGSWMRYDALYPNGQRETLLSVPHYDFNWQTTYSLPSPKRLPAGTWLLCTGGFDNSPQNPANPNPAQRVAWGEQSFNEMFIGFLETAVAPQP